MAFFSFRRRTTKPLVKQSHKSHSPAFGSRSFERLEDRNMLSISFSPPNNVQQPGGKDVLVPLTSVDSSGLPVSYTFSSSDPNVGLSLVSPGTPSLELSIAGTDNTGTPYSGTLILKLFDSLTPQSTARIEELVNEGFYNGTTFSRVLDGLIAQGGFASNATTSGQVFADEFNSQLTYTSPGLLGLANSGPDTNDEQFFITATDAKGTTTPIAASAMPQSLNFKYAIIGQLVSGFDTFQKIMQTNVVANSSTNEVSQPTSAITVTAAQIITDTQNAVLELSAPASSDGSTPTITVTASDSSGATVQHTFTDSIVTNTVIDPPFLGAVTSHSTNENSPVTFTLTSTDPENAGVAYTIVTPNFSAPQNVTVSINQSTGQVTLTPATGFTGTISLLAGVRASSAADKYSNYDTQEFTLTVEIPTSTTPVPGADAELDLSDAYNRVGITADGATFSGGLDGVGYAYSATNLGTGLTWNGLNFNFGPVGANNVVQATGQTIQLPATQYSQLTLLATGVLGNQIAQTFTVTYTDGATTTFTQSISDWFTPQNYERESVALSMPYRNTSQGTADNRKFDLYGYVIYLDSSKTVSSITLPNDTKVDVLAISLAAPITAPTNLAATAASASEVDLTWTAATGDATGYEIFRGTVSGGPYTTLLNSTPLTPGTTSFQDTSVLPGNTYYYIIETESGSSFSPTSIQAAVTTPMSGTDRPVDLTGQFDVTGITTKGAKFTTGADGIGNALSSNLLGTSVSAGGTVFNLGQVGAPNVLAALGQTIALPAGQFSQLQFLATGVRGNQTAQTFTVSYTDGTVTTLTQSLSDWFTPQHYAGESVAATMSYRNTSSGGTDNRTFNVYSYTINLDSTKTVSSLQLPNNLYVRILAVTMVPPVAAPTSLAVSTAVPNLVNLSWAAAGGTPTGYNVYRGTTSGGESATPINSVPLPAGTTTYQDSTAIPGNTYYYVVKAIDGTALSAGSNEVTAAFANASTSTAVDLTSSFNLTGITANGTKFTGGIDGVGNALSSTGLGSSVTLGGVTFDYGSTGSNNVVQALGQSVALPTGQYSKLEFQALATNGNQLGQTFTVHYTDGTTAVLTQSISDWYTPQHVAGETVAVSMTSRNTSAGGSDNRTFDVYSYTIALDSSKTVSSITLPNNSHVEVLAVSVVSNNGRCLTCRRAIRRGSAGLPPQLEHIHGQGGQCETDRVGAAVPGNLVGHHTRSVAHVAAAVIHRVAVEDFFVPTGLRYAQPVTLADDRREVATDQDEISRILGPPQEAQRTILIVVAIDPLEARRIEVDLMQGRFAAVDLVHVGHEALQSAVRFPLQQVPLQAGVVVPLVPLANFAPHEQQLLARMAPHVSEQEPQVGEFLPQIARHLIQQRALAMHHFVVRQRQREVLVKGVNQAEGQLVVVVLAMDRIVPHVADRVVHPAHVPLQAESQAAQVRGSRDSLPGG